MHFAILNSSGNVLEWFTDEQSGRDALAEMLAESREADLDLVAFTSEGQPSEPITASVRSEWPVARLVWSNRAAMAYAVQARTCGNVGQVVISNVPENTTDERVKVGA